MHEHVFGARVVRGKSCIFAASTSHYPIDLCNALANWVLGERDMQNVSRCLFCVLTGFLLCYAYCVRVTEHETFLGRSRISDVHRERLEKGLMLFTEWLALQLDKNRWLTSWEATNQIAANFVQHLFVNHYSHTHAKYALLGIQHKWKWLRHKLERPWASLKSWQLKVGSKSRIPINLDIVKAMFATSLAWALEEPRLAYLFIPLAIMIRLGFDCCLRVGELLALKLEDIVLPRCSSIASVAFVAIRNPKNRGALGLEQYSTFDAPELICWVRWFTAGMMKGAKLWPSSPFSFRQSFARVLKRMGLENLKLVPSGLRAGGCTHLHLVKRIDIPALRYKLRHKSETALASYMQEAVSALTYLQLSEAEQELIAIVEASAAVWNNPPKLPWPSLFSRWKQTVALQSRKHTNLRVRLRRSS